MYFQLGIAIVKIVSNIHIKMVYLNSKNSYSKGQEIILKKKKSKEVSSFYNFGLLYTVRNVKTDYKK